MRQSHILSSLSIQYTFPSNKVIIINITQQLIDVVKRVCLSLNATKELDVFHILSLQFIFRCLKKVRLTRYQCVVCSPNLCNTRSTNKVCFQVTNSPLLAQLIGLQMYSWGLDLANSTTRVPIELLNITIYNYEAHPCAKFQCKFCANSIMAHASLNQASFVLLTRHFNQLNK